jgi:hypothetical protein
VPASLLCYAVSRFFGVVRIFGVISRIKLKPAIRFFSLLAYKVVVTGPYWVFESSVSGVLEFFKKIKPAVEFYWAAVFGSMKDAVYGFRIAGA